MQGLSLPPCTQSSSGTGSMQTQAEIRTIESAVKDIAALNDKGVSLLERRRFPEAIATFQQASNWVNSVSPLKNWNLFLPTVPASLNDIAVEMSAHRYYPCYKSSIFQPSVVFRPLSLAKYSQTIIDIRERTVDSSLLDVVHPIVFGENFDAGGYSLRGVLILLKLTIAVSYYHLALAYLHMPIPDYSMGSSCVLECILLFAAEDILEILRRDVANENDIFLHQQLVYADFLVTRCMLQLTLDHRRYPTDMSDPRYHRRVVYLSQRYTRNRQEVLKLDVTLADLAVQSVAAGAA